MLWRSGKLRNTPVPEWNKVRARRGAHRRDRCEGVVVSLHLALSLWDSLLSGFPGVGHTRTGAARRVLEMELDPKIRMKDRPAQREGGRKET